VRRVLVRREPDAGSYARPTLQRGSSESTIKAIVQDRYGPPEVLQLREIEPPNVADDEVLVRIRAASLHPDEVREAIEYLEQGDGEERS
jgi:hypothetical protein